MLDTNTLVLALLFKAELVGIVDLWKKGRIIPILSKETFPEFKAVLEYQKFSLTWQEIKVIIEEEVLPALVYPAVIAGEEEFLQGRFGEPYAEYCRRTPRFFPDRSLFVEPDSYTVQPRTLRRSLGGVIWFIGLPVVIQILVSLRTVGALDSVARLP